MKNQFIIERSGNPAGDGVSGVVAVGTPRAFLLGIGDRSGYAEKKSQI